MGIAAITLAVILHTDTNDKLTNVRGKKAELENLIHIANATNTTTTTVY